MVSSKYKAAVKIVVTKSYIFVAYELLNEAFLICQVMGEMGYGPVLGRRHWQENGGVKLRLRVLANFSLPYWKQKSK